MILTDEQITLVKEYAAALLPANEIAILLDFDTDGRRAFDEIVKNHTSSPIYKAFHQGRLQTKFELRKIIIKLAKNGSPAAQPIAEKYLIEQKI